MEKVYFMYFIFPIIKNEKLTNLYRESGSVMCCSSYRSPWSARSNCGSVQFGPPQTVRQQLSSGKFNVSPARCGSVSGQPDGGAGGCGSEHLGYCERTDATAARLERNWADGGGGGGDGPTVPPADSSSNFRFLCAVSETIRAGVCAETRGIRVVAELGGAWRGMAGLMLPSDNPRNVEGGETLLCPFPSVSLKVLNIHSELVVSATENRSTDTKPNTNQNHGKYRNWTNLRIWGKYQLFTEFTASYT